MNTEWELPSRVLSIQKTPPQTRGADLHSWYVPAGSAWYSFGVLEHYQMWSSSPSIPVLQSDLKVRDFIAANKESTLYSISGLRTSYNDTSWLVLLAIPETTQVSEIQVHVVHWAKLGISYRFHCVGYV